MGANGSTADGSKVGHIIECYFAVICSEPARGSHMPGPWPEGSKRSKIPVSSWTEGGLGPEAYIRPTEDTQVTGSLLSNAAAKLQHTQPPDVSLSRRGDGPPVTLVTSIDTAATAAATASRQHTSSAVVVSGIGGSYYQFDRKLALKNGVGGGFSVIGGIMVLVLLLGCICCVKRKRAKRNARDKMAAMDIEAQEVEMAPRR